MADDDFIKNASNVRKRSTFCWCRSSKMSAIGGAQTKAVAIHSENGRHLLAGNRMKDEKALNWPFKGHIISGLHFFDSRR